MADYISREAAIAYIRELAEESQKAFEELGGESGIYADAYNELAEDFRKIPAADVEPVRRWIPCSERPPEICMINGEMVDYQIFCPDFGDCGRTDIGNYFPDAKEWLWMGVPVRVTHWQPLPEPPKEGGPMDG